MFSYLVYADDAGNKYILRGGPSNNSMIAGNLLAFDGNYSYHKILPKEKHFIGKSETCLVESFNARLRHWIKPLNRRTMCYPKSRNNLYMNVDLWMKKEKWSAIYI